MEISLAEKSSKRRDGFEFVATNTVGIDFLTNSAAECTSSSKSCSDASTDEDKDKECSSGLADSKSPCAQIST